MTRGFDANGVWHANGRGFQMGTVQIEGVVIHLTGQVAWDEDEQIVGKGDIEAQTRQCFRNIAALLTEVGGRLEDIVSITTYFTDRAQLPAMQKIRTGMFPPDVAPVST